MRVLVLVLSLAACDRVFGIGDPYQDAASGVPDASPPRDAGNDVASNLPPPLLHYRFDSDYKEAAGGLAATCTTSGGGDCQFELGHYDSAVHLDGSSIGEITLPTLPPHFTLMAWMQLNGGPIFDLPEMLSLPTSEVWYLQLGTNLVDFTTLGATKQETQATLGVASGWVNIAVTYDGNMQKLYVSGVLQAQTQVSTLAYGPNHVLYFGYHPSTSVTTYYAGAIDDVYVFASALTQNDIDAYMSTAR